MSTLKINTIANGLYDINVFWPKDVGIRFTMVLTDPDGDVQTDVYELTADEDLTVRDALDRIRDGIEALPHYRAIRTGTEISIGTASEDYSAEITVEEI